MICPTRYAEVLENIQFALIATVHKLYSMVRKNQQWELSEPELNDRGLPIIHSIAQKLGCIRPNCDIDLPVHSVIPEDEPSMTELACKLKEQQHHETESHNGSGINTSTNDIKETGFTPYCQTNDWASSSELDHSDVEIGFSRAAFGNNNLMIMGPHSFTGSHNLYDFNRSAPADKFLLQCDINSDLWNTNRLPFANEPQPGPHFLYELSGQPSEIPSSGAIALSPILK